MCVWGLQIFGWWLGSCENQSCKKQNTLLQQEKVICFVLLGILEIGALKDGLKGILKTFLFPKCFS